MRNIRAEIAALLIALATTEPAVADIDDSAIDEVTVTGYRKPMPVSELTGNSSSLDALAIADAAHQHPHELFSRTTGTWISRGSGQEHLAAIRSPVLTGAGSCGGFLYLEDGIPVRPPGFCNVNQLFELQTEQAQRVEVTRGPGTALYGSNALHGIVNVLMPDTSAQRGASLEAGANEFIRMRASISNAQVLGAVVFADDGGFRDDSGYRQGKLHLRTNVPLDTGTLTIALTATDLDQQTAGFILGEDAYKDPARQSNEPEPRGVPAGRQPAAVCDLAAFGRTF